MRGTALYRIREPQAQQSTAAVQIFCQFGRAVDLQWFAPICHRQGHEEAQESGDVVPMEMRDEHLPEPAEFESGPADLDLSGLSTVEQQQIALPDQGGCREVAF